MFLNIVLTKFFIIFIVVYFFCFDTAKVGYFFAVTMAFRVFRFQYMRQPYKKRDKS